MPAPQRGGGNQQEGPRFPSFVALVPQLLQASVRLSVTKTVESTFQGAGTEGPRDVTGSVWRSGKPDGDPPQRGPAVPGAGGQGACDQDEALRPWETGVGGGNRAVPGSPHSSQG